MCAACSVIRTVGLGESIDSPPFWGSNPFEDPRESKRGLEPRKSETPGVSLKVPYLRPRNRAGGPRRAGCLEGSWQPAIPHHGEPRSLADSEQVSIGSDVLGQP